MNKRLVLFLLLMLNAVTTVAQSDEDLSKPYNEVTFIATHNSFNTKAGKFRFTNQRISIFDQLNGGVRGLCLDIHEHKGELLLFHAYKSLGSEPLSKGLEEIEKYLSQDTAAVVTLFLECYTSANKVEEALREANLFHFLYTENGDEWDSIDSMLRTNKRLVIFSSRNDASEDQQWYHYYNTHIADTPYSNFKIKDLSVEVNRGHPSNAIFVLNHFVYSWVGTGSKRKAKKINTDAFIEERMKAVQLEYGRLPNFVIIDYFKPEVISGF